MTREGSIALVLVLALEVNIQIGRISISDGSGIGLGQRLTQATASSRLGSLIASRRFSRLGFDLTKIMNFMLGSKD
jgi:hypothetical protein